MAPTTFLASCAITGEEREWAERAEAQTWLDAHVAACPYRHGHAVLRQTGSWEAWNMSKRGRREQSDASGSKTWVENPRAFHEKVPGGAVTSIRHKDTGEVGRIRRGPPPSDPGKA